MTHYFIELAIWVLGFYFLGCVLGWGLRNVFGSAEQPVAAPAKMAEPIKPAYVPPTPIARPAPIPVPVAAPAPVTEPVVTGKMERPKGLNAARGGEADDLQRISGVGPKNEAILHNLGLFHFDQIAEWTESQVAWVDDHLRFGGRIKREEWIKQAGLLAAGNEAEFTKLYGTGGLRNAKGETLSGTRTRKP